MTELQKRSREPVPGYLAIIPVVVALLVMGRLGFNGFTWWDDNFTVHHNPLLNPPHLGTIKFYWLHPAFRIYAPLTYMVWTVLAVIARQAPDANGISLNPAVFHVANVLLHAGTVWVVCRILILLRMKSWAAMCGAVIFAVHPVQVEAVAWVSGLKDVLSGLLAMVALWQYLIFALDAQAGRERPGRLYLSTAILIVAMLAKSSAATVVLAGMAIDHWIIGRAWRTIISSIDVPAIATLPFLWIAHSVQAAGDIGTTPLWQRPLVVCDAIAFYIHKLLWPSGLCIDYGRTPAVVVHSPWIYVSCLISITLIATAITLRNTAKPLVAAGAVFVAGALPTLGFTSFATQFYSTTADHYLYWAMLGPALAIAWLLTRFAGSVTLRGGVIIAIILLSIVSIRQGGFWKDDVSILDRAVAINPKSFAAYNNLGSAYERRQNVAEAALAFRRAIEIKPDFSNAHSNLGGALRDLGDLDGSDSETANIDRSSASARASDQEYVAEGSQSAGTKSAGSRRAGPSDRAVAGIAGCRTESGIGDRTFLPRRGRDQARVHDIIGGLFRK